MNLIEFWNDYPVRNAYVDEAEFNHLYVRRGERNIWFPDGTISGIYCLQVANVEAKTPQKGAFGRLLAKVKKHLNVPVFVENVQRKEVAEGLVKKYGFQYVNEQECGGICWCLFLDTRV